MKLISGVKELVDRIVIRGNPENSKIIGFTKCSTTSEYIYKNGVITLCEKSDCDNCKRYQKIFKKFGGRDVPNTN